MRKLLKILIAVVLITPLVTFGQALFLNDELTILVSPQNPRPNELVSFNVVSSFPNLSNFYITWSKDGIIVKEGNGITNYKTVVGSLGKRHIITVTVTADGREKIRESITIRPSKVSLVWEADSYTPIFYKGKGLASHQANVKVVAIPSLVNTEGVRFDERSLLYEWKLDGKKDNLQSGAGKNIFKFTGSLVSRPKTVSVVVSTKSGLTTASNMETINFVEPKILIYKKNPLTGIRNNLSIKTGFVEDNESTFVSEPYFFSRQAYNSNLLEYNWVIDNNKFDNLRKSKEVTFSGEVSGKSNVSIKIINPNRILQGARSLFDVIVN